MQKGAGKENGLSLAKMVSKTQMSLRMPIVATTMEIQQYKGTLFKYYEPKAKEFYVYKTDHTDFTKEEFIKFLKKMRAAGVGGYTDSLIRLTVNSKKEDFFETFNEVIKIATDNGRECTLTEQESLEEELSSLKKQTRDYGTGSKIAPNDPPPDLRFPIKFSVMGLNFEAMPFEDIKVTQVQTGYTREITPPLAHGSQVEQNDTLRVGKPVRHSARFTDPDKNIWYVANQLTGEGIFIHLDPEKHKDGTDVLGTGSESTDTWKNMHEETKQRNERRCKLLEHEKNSEQVVDALRMEITLTNPLFVWWHSFVHELINQFAIDSGFMGASLGERVYCVTKNGKSDAGRSDLCCNPGHRRNTWRPDKPCR